MKRSLVLAALLLLGSCRPPASGAERPAAGAEALPGVDASVLTGREQQEWWAHVSTELAPCVDVPVSIATCVSESRDCRACVPAAKFFVDQVRQGRPREQARNAYRLRFDEALVKTLDLSGSPSKGPAAARVTIVEWADFQCPFCAEAAPMIESARSAYPSDVRLVFKHFPLDRHAHAVDAARAGVAAELQGKFWPMHERLYAQHGQIDRSLVLQLAAELGLDTAKLQRDMEDAATVASIERDKRQADALGLKGTPLIYINGRHFDLDYFDLSTDLLPWVELELELTKPVGG